MPDETTLTDPSPTPASKWQRSRVARVAVRVLRTYLQGVAGFLTAGTLGNVLPGNPVPMPAEAGDALRLVFYAPLFPALYALVMNSIEELNALDPGTSLRG